MHVESRHEDGTQLPVLVWRLATPMRTISSSVLGGGLGMRDWVMNAQVPSDYARRDPGRHLAELAAAFGLVGPGVGLLTATDVRRHAAATDGGVEVVATVGLGMPTRAAAASDPRTVPVVGTVNIVVFLPEQLSDAALVNAVTTVTEAKVQAIRDLGIDATGTPTDAVCIVCPPAGVAHPFGGPRSTWGARLARAVHHAVLTGAR